MNRSYACLLFAAYLFLLPAAASAGAVEDQVEAVGETYRAAGDVSADFTQDTFVEVLGTTVAKRGVFRCKHGGKFRIEYAGTQEKTYVSNGRLLWVYIPGDASSLVTYEVDGESVPREALAFLSGFDNLRRDFRITRSDAFDGGAEGYALHLDPKSRKAHFKALDAKFNGDNLLVELKVHNKSGNVSHYRFTNIRTKAGIADSVFVPDGGS